jgi:DNA repair exonuclease SbcCD ATPase subunit
MRIKSVKVRNYRVIGDWVVEFDDSMTLLAGPNETGKSTLIEALHRGLFLKASGNNEKIQGMASTLHLGGPPEVELTFEAGARSYRLAKTFKQGGGTSLADDVGNQLLGLAAETQLANILRVDVVNAASVTAQWAHLWVWQGKSGDDPTVHATNQINRLLDQLPREGGAVAMQSELDKRVAMNFLQKKSEIYNDRGGVRPASFLGGALSSHEAASQAREVAEGALNRQRETIDDSLAASREIARINELIQELEGEQRKAGARLGTVASLRQTEQLQLAAAADSARQHEELLQADNSIRRIRGEIQEQRQLQEPLVAEALRLTAAKVEAEAQVQSTEAAHNDAAASTRQARLRQELAVAHHTLFEKQSLRDALQAKQAGVNTLRLRVANLERELARLPSITPAKLRRVQRLQGELESSRAALNAMAAGIELLAADQEVQVDGAALEVGQPRILIEPTDLRVGPSVHLRIRPGGGTTLAEAKAMEQNIRTDLQALLDDLGVASPEAAARDFAAAKQLADDIRAEKARLEGLDADMIDGHLAGAENDLLAAQSEAQQRGGLLAEVVPLPADITEALSLKAATSKALRAAESEESRANSARDAAIGALRAAGQSLESHGRTMRDGDARLNGLLGQLELLLGMHPADDARTIRLQELRARRDNDARELAATREQLANLQPELLEQDAARLERSIGQRHQERNRAENRLAEARGGLRRDGSSTDPQAEFASAKAREGTAREQLSQAQGRAQAVKLLHQLFDEEKRALSEQFTNPFAERITGYLQCLFGPGVRAQVQLDGNRFQGLRMLRPGRGDAAIDFENLSAGTREQLAAAVRLAMAEVLARGHDGCLPVVFDDAFANSDPERISLLHRMLDLAARRGLQVIVLTCDPSDYAGLGAKTVHLGQRVP